MNHRALCAGTKSRRIRSAGQRDQQEFLGTEHADQTGREAGRGRGRTGEDLPTEVRLALTPTASTESSASASASLFPDEGLPPHEKRILGLLKSDESTHIDESVEKLETELSSSEIFAALFDWELAGKVRQMPGKHFEKSF